MMSSSTIQAAVKIAFIFGGKAYEPGDDPVFSAEVFEELQAAGFVSAAPAPAAAPAPTRAAKPARG